jgi:hypothetical protein
MTREEIALREWQLSGDELTIRFTRPYRDGTDAECVAKAVRAFVEALAKPGADVPEGWVLVPREPTEAMIEAFAEAHHELGFHAWANCSFVWPRMLATAPPAPADDADGWRPIETAPKDGTRVLLWPHNCVGWWEFGDDQWMVLAIPLNEDHTIADDWREPSALTFCVYADQLGREPLLWHPLPPPPQPKEGER